MTELTYIEATEQREGRNILHKFKCSCGKIVLARKTPQAQSCGCKLEQYYNRGRKKKDKVSK